MNNSISIESFFPLRNSHCQTPISTKTLKTKRSEVKSEKSISDIYKDLKHKFNEMEDVFSTEKTSRQRQMLKTYIKILEKIGEEVLEAKQRYQNLDKEVLKTDKRLQIVEELNEERSKCNKLTSQIKKLREERKKIEDENIYLEQEVRAYSSVQRKKSLLKKEEKIRYFSVQKSFNQHGSFNIFRQMASNINESSAFAKTLEMSTFKIKKFLVEGDSQIFNQKVHPHRKVSTAQKQIRKPLLNQDKYLSLKRRKNNLMNLSFPQTMDNSKQQSLNHSKLKNNGNTFELESAE